MTFCAQRREAWGDKNPDCSARFSANWQIQIGLNDTGAELTIADDAHRESA
jgi:hypothetical protein